jgi:hypothetical protein
MRSDNTFGTDAIAGVAALCRVMRYVRDSAAVVALVIGVGFEAGSAPVGDEASAIAAAKKYTKGRCTAETPCTFKPRREGKQWNVWVEFTKRNSRGEKAYPYPGGHVLLYFDAEGRLVRRVQGE